MNQKDFSRVAARLTDYLEKKGTSQDQRHGTAHVRSVQARVEAIGRGDLSAALENAADDVLLEIFAPPEFRWIRHARGIDALRAAIAHNFDSVENQTPEILNVVAEGDNVVLFGRERGAIRETGQPYDVQFVERFTFIEGRLASVRIVAAKTEAPSDIPTPLHEPRG
jgi:ketosteroid isomerase-like protein